MRSPFSGAPTFGKPQEEIIYDIGDIFFEDTLECGCCSCCGCSCYYDLEHESEGEKEWEKKWVHLTNMNTF